MCERNSSSETKGWRAGEKRGGAGVSTELYMVAQTVKRLSTMRRPGFDPWVGKIPGEGNGNPLQYYCLEIPWTEEPGRLQSVGSQRVGHD